MFRESQPLQSLSADRRDTLTGAWIRLPVLGAVKAVAIDTDGLDMTKSTRNTGKHWSPQDVRQLNSLADQNTPTRVIGLKLGRTEQAVRSKASDESISLRPTNQSPYNRSK